MISLLSSKEIGLKGAIDVKMQARTVHEAMKTQTHAYMIHQWPACAWPQDNHTAHTNLQNDIAIIMIR